MKFTELDLRPQLQKAIEKLGFEDLTPIQERTYGDIMAGRDMIGLAETGSGKTLACGIPIVQSVDHDLNAVQALVMVPTRELALQYVAEIADICKYTDLAPFAVYGGFDINTQKAKLEHGVHILVATPGRLIDLIYNSPLSLSEVRTFVLDEADEMLNMGFLTDIEFIFSCLVHEHQTLLFSATMPESIKKLGRKYLKDPVVFELNVENAAPSSLEHYFQNSYGKGKFSTLVKYLKSEDPTQAIIFCRSRMSCERTFDHLKKEVDSCDIIHGGIEQNKRSSIFNRFKKKKVRFIVATDIASRGLDFSEVTHVINYDFPNNAETYTHRTGRTARMGRKGKALTLYSKSDLPVIKEIIVKNKITVNWIGDKPDIDKIRTGKKKSSWKGGGKFKGKKNFKRRTKRKTTHKKTPKSD